jgi:hypothetical protein
LWLVFGIKESEDPLGEGDAEGSGEADGEDSVVGLVAGAGSWEFSDGAGADVDCVACGEEPQAPSPTAMAAMVPVNRLRRLNGIIEIPSSRQNPTTEKV